MIESKNIENFIYIYYNANLNKLAIGMFYEILDDNDMHFYLLSQSNSKKIEIIEINDDWLDEWEEIENY